MKYIMKIEESLRSNLLPLYKKMIDENKFSDVCVFCIQWGNKFPENENTGIIFVGKAVNSWINSETDINILFGKSEDRIFARDDQMEWVHKSENDHENYNTKKSAFWRLVKGISKRFYSKEDWFSYVAWSNLCKIAPFEGGNPNDSLYYEQLESCCKILEKEVQVLSPKFVVMLTSGWERDFLFPLNKDNDPECIENIIWDGYETKIYKINSVFYITSPHPQGKGEKKHIEAVTELITKYRLK